MSRARDAAYRRGIDAAAAAHAVKLFAERKARPADGLRAIAARYKTRRVRQWLQWTADGAGKTGVSKRALAKLRGDLRDMATRERLEVAQASAPGGARAKQLRQVRAISASLARSRTK